MNRQQQELLLAEYIDGTASHERSQELLNELRNNPQLKEQLSIFLLIEQELYTQHRANSDLHFRDEVINCILDDSSGRHFTNDTIEELKRKNPQRKHTRSHHRKKIQQQFPVMWWIAAAAALLIAIALWPEEITTPTITPQVIVVEKHIEAPRIIGVWKNYRHSDIERVAHAPQPSTSAYLGDIMNCTQDSLLVLDDSSEIRISANSKIELKKHENILQVHLHHGTIKATVSPQKPGTAIEFPTKYGSSRIIGTAFELSSNHTNSRLEVSHGRIKQSNIDRHEAVFVDAGYFVIIQPKTDLIVQAIQQPKTAPEPQIIAPPVKTPEIVTLEPSTPINHFYEWHIKNNTCQQWVRGKVKTGTVSSAPCFNDNVIYARIHQSKRQPLLNDDVFHFHIRSPQAQKLQLRIYLADNNPLSISEEQYGWAEIDCTQKNAGAWNQYSFTLNDLEFTAKDLSSRNTGCFAFRLQSNSHNKPFAINKAYISRQ
ncbi:MAG: FecR domain-containing protein [Planctomycetes bacterium]|nr:FecR domain-containing protein [Planctomycetota bacterium]